VELDPVVVDLDVFAVAQLLLEKMLAAGLEVISVEQSENGRPLEVELDVDAMPAEELAIRRMLVVELEAIASQQPEAERMLAVELDVDMVAVEQFVLLVSNPALFPAKLALASADPHLCGPSVLMFGLDLCSSTNVKNGFSLLVVW
jgi:hypothetical protein